MDIDGIDGEYDEYEYYEDDYPDDMMWIEDASLPLSPDPILIAGVTILAGLLLFGFLFHLTFQVFGESIAITSQQSGRTNNVSGNLDNSESQSTNQEKAEEIWSGDCAVSQQFPPKITRWCELITQYATKHNLDPDLIAAVVWLESGGNEVAYSRSGAVGLMQVMPRDGLAASFMCVNGPCFKDRPSTDELRDPEFNIAFGTRFLASLVRRTGNIRDALKSYGPMDAGYTYSDKVLSIFNRYKSD